MSLLGYEFAQWDVHKADVEALAGGHASGVVCLLSNIMCYCTDEATADLFTRLLTGPVAAIVANERGAEQGIARGGAGSRPRRTSRRRAPSV